MFMRHAEMPWPLSAAVLGIFAMAGCSQWGTAPPAGAGHALGRGRLEQAFEVSMNRARKRLEQQKRQMGQPERSATGRALGP